jgi:hypothetical protein
MKIVYDFGAHNGSNIPYYLLKFNKVVAIEANPELAKEIKHRFKNEIEKGKVVVLNSVVSLLEQDVDFYIHKTNSVLSQLPAPQDIENFNVIQLKSKKASSIIFEHGLPEYVKIDIEHTDPEIIEDLFANGIFPKYLSAEMYQILSFIKVAASNRYQEYKLLDGRSVSEVYSNVLINNQEYSFPFHSAGPMWEDIKQEPMDLNTFFNELGRQGLGWKDMHVKRIDNE